MTPYTRWAPRYLIRWLFNQERIWITARGEEKQVADMNREHALNTILMLERVRADIEPELRDGLVCETPLYKALKERAFPSIDLDYKGVEVPERATHRIRYQGFNYWLDMRNATWESCDLCVPFRPVDREWDWPVGTFAWHKIVSYEKAR